MDVRCLTTGDAEEWDAVLARCAGADVHFSAAYHRACEADERGAAVLVVADAGTALLVHPVLVRPVERVGAQEVDEAWCDAESVYGYTGPLAGGAVDEAFLGAAWERIAGALRERGVIAEFVRLHPYLENGRLLPSAYDVFPVRRSVVLPLAHLTADELWASYPSVQRNMVRRAERAGLVCRSYPVEGDALRQFALLYEHAMARLDAAPEYFFSHDYLEALGGGLGDRARLLFAEDGAGVTAAGLFLAGDSTVHYHLGASDATRPVPGRTNLVLHSAAVWALERGAVSLHLGGGVTAAPDDALYRFKRTVSRETLPVHAAGAVHDERAYASLCEAWLAQVQPSSRPPFHLVYRLPVPG